MCAFVFERITLILTPRQAFLIKGLAYLSQRRTGNIALLLQNNKHYYDVLRLCYYKDGYRYSLALFLKGGNVTDN